MSFKAKTAINTLLSTADVDNVCFSGVIKRGESRNVKDSEKGSFRDFFQQRVFSFFVE
jgi:hypothetical protein